VDVPTSYNPKIYNERQEISCRRVDRTPMVQADEFIVWMCTIDIMNINDVYSRLCGH